MPIRLDPFIGALLLAALLGAFLPATGSAFDVVQALSMAAIALLFFFYGARLSFAETIAGLTAWKVHGVILSITYIALPLIGIGVYLLELLPGSLSTGVLLVCLVPSTVQSAVAFTSIAGGDRALAVVSSSLSNLLGVFLTPALVALVLTSDVEIGANQVLRILGLLLAPFILGQLLHRWLGGFMKRNDKSLKLYDRGSIVFVVYMAFSSGSNANVWTAIGWADAALMLLVCAAVLALAFGITIIAGKPFARPQRAAIMFCGTNKSLASGLPMASVLFPPDQVALVILPLMAYHQIQLITCSIIANRMAPPPVVEPAKA